MREPDPRASAETIELAAKTKPIGLPFLRFFLAMSRWHSDRGSSDFPTLGQLRRDSGDLRWLSPSFFWSVVSLGSRRIGRAARWSQQWRSQRSFIRSILRPGTPASG
jgi:hypothetical protein